MILVDTSVWIEHFRVGLPGLKALLEDEQVLTHPFVIGELACGNLRNRIGILGLLERIPQAPLVEPWEVLTFVTDRRLYGRGIGWLDAHLLASAVLSRAALWTLDPPLGRLAAALGIAHR